MTHPSEPDERRALARLAFDELRRAPGGVWGMHRAIADRAFGASGPGAIPSRVAHNAIAGAVYGALGGAVGLLGRAADTTLGRLGDERRVISTSPRGSAVVAGITGLIGDQLERERSDLHQPMAVRVHGQPIPAEPGALATAFPAVTPRLVVFLHGLMETEFSWRFGARERGDTYGTRLARDLGCTPVYVRYNSGRRISQNGRDLARLLGALVEAWPADVTEIALVGHSMGGLVARSACHAASEEQASWVRLVRHVVSLGSPHMGAPLEQVVHVASAALHAVPEMRPFSGYLRRRSGGIRDLRHGSLVDEDWQGRDPDALRAAACREIPLLDGATHCFVAATITRSPRHPLARLVGDCLVLEPSASGRSRTRTIPFRAEHGMHLGGASHFALLNHPQVYERLRDWLATPSREAPVGA
jgi:pimeloyl-ACP methyl ester carboxylesterase